MIHPEIEKFWKRISPVLKIPFRSNNINYIGYFVCINYYYTDLKNLVAFQIEDQNNIWYMFQGKSYSEKEMLKIIKLKVFI